MISRSLAQRKPVNSKSPVLRRDRVNQAEDLRPERVDDAGSREEMTRKNNRKEETMARGIG
jgi:hypothetical protein